MGLIPLLRNRPARCFFHWAGVSNCCKSCGTAIQKAVKSVAGVTGDTVQPKKADFEVTGDFDTAALVKALNDAGFQVQVK
jgi:periplasmic mercuric ion binding protein